MARKIIVDKQYDVICVGGGIMSATLALILKLLDPELKIVIFERLDEVGLESSAARNNAGTYHSALCELNYTPEKEDGSIDVTKALKIFSQFEQSKHFWSFLMKEGLIKDPAQFIHSIPHHSWVRGEKNVRFLKKRYEALQFYFMFENMKYSEDDAILKDWFPLIMENRDSENPTSATRMETGTGVNFGTLTKDLIHILRTQFDVPVLNNHEVLDVDPERKSGWLAEVENRDTKEKLYLDSKKIFIGAGGAAIPLLQKVEIKEKEGYGGFPISGQWLMCKNPEIIKQHNAKVYSKADIGSPPMSVPHLDTRYINGKKELLFGPFAYFSTKFLKEGSYADLPKSINFSNLPAMWGVFWHNLPLTKYLLDQVKMTHKDRIEELRVFIKDAKPEDWELEVAGQRVQIIKRDAEEGGVLEFGTDVVHNNDGSITALLGASPGASVSVHVMLDVIKIGFPAKIESKAWRRKLSEMIPFYDRSILDHKTEFRKKQEENAELLKLNAAY
ncbi:malate dehydrogenase (quinone) [Antarcticibacterium sp. 1MA-6-2]|uniref:malate dehydrogenase (quinone) n=1 Tax=Antarcticibacterium sp. 1MA-6-2 TaxID=2908210 RepID=UPI001F25835A|nr:malate dehydrogenase (quinone) [Antarcticibacterium sp. 1MA-6-2]UJH92413.1 malate dehydrogenase (quinone) [Antarcticibacterium sp. 1MA-6-2]